MDKIDYIKKIEESKGDISKMISYTKSYDLGEHDLLLLSYSMVRKLLDFKQVIDKNLDQLELEEHKKTIEMGLEDHLTRALDNYIILEIYSFYEYIISEQRKDNLLEIKIPEDYINTLKNLRHQIVAHKDHQGKLVSAKDFLNLYIEIDKIGMQKIIEDFNKNMQVLLKKEKEKYK